jgi:hypothetical protein
MKVVVAPDEHHWAWSYSTASGALYQLDGLR